MTDDDIVIAPVLSSANVRIGWELTHRSRLSVEQREHMRYLARRAQTERQQAALRS